MTIRYPATAPLPALILASGSPRRRELLAALGLPFAVRVSDVPEPLTDAPPAEQATDLAIAKAQAVAATAPDAAVIGADTIVVLDGRPLGKPADAAEAATMLRSLRGRAHQVVTGVAVARGGRVWSAAVTTTVQMRAYDDDAIADTIDRGEPFDKAGGYAIQDERLAPVERIDGCYCNVMGLPLWLLTGLLGRAAPELPAANPDQALPRCAACPTRPLAAPS